MKLEEIKGKQEVRPIVPNKKENSRLPPIFKDLKEPIKKGDNLRVNDKYVIGKESILDKKLIVKKCWLSNLGDMLVWMVKFEDQEGVENPYLAHHFIKL